MTQDEFLRAYDALSDALFRHCFFRVHDRELAKDLVQETFTRTWAYVARGNAIANLKAFLYRTATNLIIDQSRKKKSVSLEELEETGFEPKVDGIARMEAGIDARRILAVIDRLDEKYRDVIVLRYVEELGPKEISGLLGISENVVSVRLYRALDQLRNILKLYER